MKPINKRRILLLLTVALLVPGVVWIITPANSRYAMPIYRGKTAEQWFFGSNGHPGLAKTMEDARVAFRAMGTNCVPFLLDKAKTRDTSFNRFYCWLRPNLPKWLQTQLRPAVRTTYVQMIAYCHLRDLTLESDFMADELLASVKTIHDDGTRFQAFQSLEVLAERWGDTEKKKAYFLSCLNDSDFQIQLQSAVVLSRLDNKLTNGLPILAMALTNATFLGQSITSQWPSGSFWFLSSELTNTIRYKQQSAYEALRLVSPKLAKQLWPTE